MEAVAGASLEWDLRDDTDLAALWAMLAELDVLDVVVGLGAPLLAAMRANVPGYRSMREFKRGRYTMPSTPHALWTLVLGDSPGTVFERVERLKRKLGQHLRIVQSTSLFSYRQGRDLTGYKDGSANPQGDEALAAALVGAEQADAAGSSFALVQRWLHFRDRFHGLSGTERDHVIGRGVETDEELEDAPPSAHVRRTEQESYEPPAFIFRRSMPWGDGRRHGLQFIAFMSNLDKADRLLERMVGATDDVADAILGHTQAETGGYYYVPPVTAGRLLLPQAAVPDRPAAAAVDGISVAEAHGMRLEVDIERCIHSRNCVSSRPDVFVPNVQGPWLHPELASAEELLALARNCPSGAIQVRPLSEGIGEEPPERAVIRLCENGPYAVHGMYSIAGRSELRATLCRCGNSARKPYCDGSHVKAAFMASGEPECLDSAQPAPPSAGQLISIMPMADGPLVVHGAVEIIGSSGKQISGAPNPTLCRCGHSANKPFCDGSHARVGFSASE